MLQLTFLTISMSLVKGCHRMSAKRGPYMKTNSISHTVLEKEMHRQKVPVVHTVQDFRDRRIISMIVIWKAGQRRQLFGRPIRITEMAFSKPVTRRPILFLYRVIINKAVCELLLPIPRMSGYFPTVASCV